MIHRCIPQEGLKAIACITMLLDHIGAVFLPESLLLRCIGRLAFPVYCFLIAEGSHYTKDPGKYALRLTILALLSEVPFELALYGGYTQYRQNVILTLLTGFFALEAMKQCPNLLLKALVAVPFVLVGRYLRSDYGYRGVMLIVLFGLTRQLPYRHLLQLLGMAAIFGPMASAELLHIGGFTLKMQQLALLAMVPIALYSGEKRTMSKAVQWGFNLFYPVHLAIIALIKTL